MISTFGVDLSVGSLVPTDAGRASRMWNIHPVVIAPGATHKGNVNRANTRLNTLLSEASSKHVCLVLAGPMERQFFEKPCANTHVFTIPEIDVQKPIPEDLRLAGLLGNIAALLNQYGNQGVKVTVFLAVLSLLVPDQSIMKMESWVNLRAIFDVGLMANKVVDMLDRVSWWFNKKNVYYVVVGPFPSCRMMDVTASANLTALVFRSITMADRFNRFIPKTEFVDTSLTIKTIMQSVQLGKDPNLSSYRVINGEIIFSEKVFEGIRNAIWTVGLRQALTDQPPGYIKHLASINNLKVESAEWFLTPLQQIGTYIIRPQR